MTVEDRLNSPLDGDDGFRGLHEIPRSLVTFPNAYLALVGTFLNQRRRFGRESIYENNSEEMPIV
jgi:hypothetical protein